MNSLIQDLDEPAVAECGGRRHLKSSACVAGIVFALVSGCAASAEDAAISQIERLGGTVRPFLEDGEQRGWQVMLNSLRSADQALDQALEHVSTLPRLRVLNLQESNVTDDGLKWLRGLSDLEFLYLSGARIGNQGLAHFEKLTKLKRLELCGTRISNDGLASLEGMINLEELELSNTQITGEGLVLSCLANFGQSSC